MPNYTADRSSEFEWPPRDDVLERQVVILGDPIEPAASSSPAAGEPYETTSAGAAGAREQTLEEPHVALRRAIEAREAHRSSGEGADSAARSTLSPRARSNHSKRSRARPGTIAVIALLAIALLQAAYILRTWSGRPLFSARGAETPPAPPVESPTATLGRSEPTTVPDAPKAPAPVAKPDVEQNGGVAVPAAPASTLLTVRSDPPGARVSIDGRYRGVTPVSVSGLTPGEHRVELERDGVEVGEAIRLNPGGTVSLLVPIRAAAAATGWISVESPLEVDVYEAGSLIGTSRSSRILLSSGPHSLQLVNPQFNFRDVRQVEVAPGEVLRIPVDLPRSDVLVNATPWAEVWIDGQHVGQTPIGKLTLPIGTHEVVFRHPDFGQKTATAIVKAGAATRVTIDMRPQLP